MDMSEEKRANIYDYGLIGESSSVTNRIREALTKYFQDDDKTSENMVKLISRDEFSLNPPDKNAVKKLVKDDDYWSAADKFIISWVGRKASAATFGVLLDALKEVGWGTLEASIVKHNWATIEGIINTKSEALEQLR